MKCVLFISGFCLLIHSCSSAPDKSVLQSILWLKQNPPVVLNSRSTSLSGHTYNDKNNGIRSVRFDCFPPCDVIINKMSESNEKVFGKEYVVV